MVSAMHRRPDDSGSNNQETAVIQIYAFIIVKPVDGRTTSFDSPADKCTIRIVDTADIGEAGIKNRLSVSSVWYLI
jgi:hypothetical protein